MAEAKHEVIHYSSQVVCTVTLLALQAILPTKWLSMPAHTLGQVWSLLVLVRMTVLLEGIWYMKVLASAAWMLRTLCNKGVRGGKTFQKP